MTPAVDGINQLMSDYVLKNSLVDVQYLENIDDNKQIKVYEYTGSVTVIEDVEIIREIESIIRSSDYMDMAGCPYKNVVELIKNNGDVIRLQFAADGCDGFIIGSSACYSPGGERWERMCDLLGIIK